MDEFTVRLAPGADSKKSNVFKMHKDDNVNWTEAKMKRENDYQPWQIKFGAGKTSRRFKAIKEGGVGDNASYFVFYKPENSNTYEVSPVDDWYSMSATQRYKCLSAEEAELRYEQIHKTHNMFSLMKRGPDEEDQDRETPPPVNSDSEPEEEDTKKKVRPVKTEAPEEAKEESDEGDFEQEVDYITDSSESSEDSDVKGVAEENGMRDFLHTDDEEDEVETKKESKIVTENKGTDESDDSSDSDDYDVDEDKMDSLFMKKNLPSQLAASAASASKNPPTIPTATPSTSASQKRKADPSPAPAPAKKTCHVESQQSVSEKIIEDLVVKYLSRKPITLKTLLKEILAKLKKMGLLPTSSPPGNNDNLVNTLASIIKRLQPHKEKRDDSVFFFFKND